MVISLGICSREEAFGSEVSSAVDDCDANNLDVTTAPGRQNELSLHRSMTHLSHLFDVLLLGWNAATKALHSLDENMRAMAPVMRTTATRDPRACALMLILLQRHLSTRLVSPEARHSLYSNALYIKSINLHQSSSIAVCKWGGGHRRCHRAENEVNSSQQWRAENLQTRG